MTNEEEAQGKEPDCEITYPDAVAPCEGCKEPTQIGILAASGGLCGECAAKVGMKRERRSQ